MVLASFLESRLGPRPTSNTNSEQKEQRSREKYAFSSFIAV